MHAFDERIVGDFYAGAFYCRADCGEGNLGAVVVMTEVAEKNVPEPWRGYSGQICCGVGVVEVAA